MPVEKPSVAADPPKDDSGPKSAQSAEPRPRKVSIERRVDGWVLTTNHAVGEGKVDVYDAGASWDAAAEAAKRYAKHFTGAHGHPYEADTVYREPQDA